MHWLNILKRDTALKTLTQRTLECRTVWFSNNLKLEQKFEKNSVWNSNKNSKDEPRARHCTASCGSCHLTRKSNKLKVEPPLGTDCFRLSMVHCTYSPDLFGVWVDRWKKSALTSYFPKIIKYGISTIYNYVSMETETQRDFLKKEKLACL
jgi:cytochrome c2